MILIRIAVNQSHPGGLNGNLFLGIVGAMMIFSKSLSYAVRGVLYIAKMQDTKRFVQAEEIAERLDVPRHFMSKILKKLAKNKFILSVKGPTGGFTITAETLDTSIMNVVEKMEGLHSFQTCVLRLQECSDDKPCAMHNRMKGMRDELKVLLSNTTFRQLMDEDTLKAFPLKELNPPTSISKLIV